MKTIAKHSISLLTFLAILCAHKMVFASHYTTLGPDTLELKDDTISTLNHQVRPGWTVYLHAGSTNFFQSIDGEVDENYNNLFNKKGLVGGITINRSISNIFSVQAEYQKGYFSEYRSEGASFKALSLLGVINLTSMWNDDSKSQFIQMYAKIGGGLNQFYATPEIPEPLSESSWKYQGGLFLDLNLNKNFAIRSGITMEQLFDRYYEGNSDKDYNTKRYPSFWVWDVGLAYKFNFSPLNTPQEIQMDEEVEMSPLVVEELYGNRNINKLIVLTPPLIAGKEQRVEITIELKDNQDNAKFTFIPPLGTKVYDEESGEYVDKFISINLESLTPENGKYVIPFEILAADDIPQTIDSLSTNITYDFKGNDEGLDFYTSNIEYADWEFKIQVAAFSENHLSVDELMQHFNLSETPIIEEVDGIKRYMINGYKTYRASKNKAQEIMESSFVEEAFVVGYKNNIRMQTLVGEFIPPHSR